MGVSTRVNTDVDMLKQDTFLQICRRDLSNFTRRRKMPCDTLIASILARKGRTLKIELREFGKVEGMEKISVPGYLKQREKLNPEALNILARHHATNVYASDDVECYKGHLLLSIDGSTANLPTTPETLAVYGDTSGHGKPQAMCGLSCIFDSLNRQIIDTTISRGRFNERAQVPIHLDILPEVIGDRLFILVMDRGYQSMPLITQLSDAKVPYVIRCASGFLIKEFEEAREAGGDKELLVKINRSRLGRAANHDPEVREKLKNHDPVPARLVLVDIGTGVDERIITNLSPDEFSVSDLKEIYHLRWNIETCFGVLKDKLQMENFTGTKPILIEQDIFASAYLLNVMYDFANEVDRRISKDQHKYKHTMTVNKSFTLGVVKHELLHILLSPEDKRDMLTEALIEELQEQLVPIRKDRSYSRGSLKTARHNTFSNTHKRVF